MSKVLFTQDTVVRTPQGVRFLSSGAWTQQKAALGAGIAVALARQGADVALA
ncbi:MAG: hypothetical protein H5T69_11650, partial [Chloroflexi bacterium]|nr:hypothetical protein [Chloroflexota bacterium]